MARAIDLWLNEDSFTVEVLIKVPLDWFPKLSAASEQDFEDFEIMNKGTVIHWPKLDEDLSVDGIVREWAQRLPSVRESAQRLGLDTTVTATEHTMDWVTKRPFTEDD